MNPRKDSSETEATKLESVRFVFVEELQRSWPVDDYFYREISPRNEVAQIGPLQSPQIIRMKTLPSGLQLMQVSKGSLDGSLYLYMYVEFPNEKSAQFFVPDISNQKDYNRALIDFFELRATKGLGEVRLDGDGVQILAFFTAYSRDAMTSFACMREM